MKFIGLLSDTHSYLHPRVFEFFSACDEIWHAGDIGNLKTAESLSGFKPFRAVYGNIDGRDIRMIHPETAVFHIENVKVAITHVGGYPGHYEKGIKEFLIWEHPKLFITGHSHILKVIYDKKLELLHINPGAAGKYGFHQSITMIRFVIDNNTIRDLEVLDIPR
jgi:uncharacterized protein